MAEPFSLPAHTSVVVIGGTGGIGSAIARQFLDLGAQVTITGASDRDIATCGLADTPGVTCAVLDVTDDAAMVAFADGIARVDVLVNCAGILRRDAEYDIKTFRQVIDVNLTGTFSACIAFRARLAETQGAIINIASMNAERALPRLPGYCASKAGVVMVTRALSHAWAPDGIRVNAVAPGFIETELNAEGRADRAHYDRIADRTALKRWGLPEDVAGAVVFLAMPAARYVTGSVYAVDGGFLAS
ncbi:MAG: oxidoreductase [Confluentimicrobium sp.]|nr:oxidoreductase [Actibacterium sp.]|tara:strand:+ start:529 stop:1263 length:735 start_codon:yes stop_codon:yes gene_type:complete